jgi:hypothetical protein
VVVVDLRELRTMPKKASTARYIVWQDSKHTVFENTGLYHNTGHGTDWQHGFTREECKACPVCPDWPRQGRRRVERVDGRRVTGTGRNRVRRGVVSPAPSNNGKVETS